MLFRRKIELRPSTPGLPQTLITRQQLIDCGQVNEVLARARAQAVELLRSAQEASDALLENARCEFWQQANGQLERWQMEHATLCEELESSASQVVNQALRHLLDDLPPPARITALLEQLVRAQCPPLNATLRCHPQAREDVQQWLNTRADSVWQLQTDERLDPLTLALVTAQGDLRIDWPGTLENLLLPADNHGTDEALPATE